MNPYFFHGLTLGRRLPSPGPWDATGSDREKSTDSRPDPRRLRFLTLLASLAFSIGSAQSSAPAPAPDPANQAAATRAPINPALPTVFIAGDSTAARGNGNTQEGWGVPFAAYFDPTRVNVVNRARGGRSSRTFITEGAWDQLLAEVKAGDTVLIQFGHNDGGPINDEPPPPLRARGASDDRSKQANVKHGYG